MDKLKLVYVATYDKYSGKTLESFELHHEVTSRWRKRVSWQPVLHEDSKRPVSGGFKWAYNTAKHYGIEQPPELRAITECIAANTSYSEATTKGTDLLS